MVKVSDNVRGVQAGRRFGNRVVLGRPFTIGTVGPKNISVWSAVVQCDCGKVEAVRIDNLLSGRATRCLACSARMTKTKHGDSSSTSPLRRLHGMWHGMRQRCTNEKHKSYADYGGRGIKVCKEWSSYEAFREWAIGAGYGHGMDIDRIDNEGDYKPDNCRWVSRTINANNTRNNTRVEAFGELKTIAEWSRDSRCVVSAQILRSRIFKSNWDIETAITRERLWQRN